MQNIMLAGNPGYGLDHQNLWGGGGVQPQFSPSPNPNFMHVQWGLIGQNFRIWNQNFTSVFHIRKLIFLLQAAI